MPPAHHWHGARKPPPIRPNRRRLGPRQAAGAPRVAGQCSVAAPAKGVFQFGAAGNTAGYGSHLWVILGGFVLIVVREAGRACRSPRARRLPLLAAVRHASVSNGLLCIGYQSFSWPRPFQWIGMDSIGMDTNPFVVFDVAVDVSTQHDRRSHWVGGRAAHHRGPFPPAGGRQTTVNRPLAHVHLLRDNWLSRSFYLAQLPPNQPPETRP